MQRAAVIASSALQRLATEAFARPQIVARAASLAGTPLYRSLVHPCSVHRPLAHLLPPVYYPARGYAGRPEAVPSDEDDLDDEFDDKDDDYEDLDDDADRDENWSDYENGKDGGEDSD